VRDGWRRRSRRNMGVVAPTLEKSIGFRGTPPETPGREGFSLSALSLLVVDIATPIEIRQRSHWEAGESQVTPVYLNEYKF